MNIFRIYTALTMLLVSASVLHAADSSTTAAKPAATATTAAKPAATAAKPATTTTAAKPAATAAKPAATATTAAKPAATAAKPAATATTAAKPAATAAKPAATATTAAKPAATAAKPAATAAKPAAAKAAKPAPKPETAAAAKGSAAEQTAIQAETTPVKEPAQPLGEPAPDPKSTVNEPVPEPEKAAEKPVVYKDSKLVPYLIITANYATPLFLAETARKETGCPVVIVPEALPHPEKGTLLTVKMKNDNTIVIRAEDLSRFLVYLRPRNVIILGNEDVVPPIYSLAVPEGANTIPVSDRAWKVNAIRLDDLLNTGHAIYFAYRKYNKQRKLESDKAKEAEQQAAQQSAGTGTEASDRRP